MNSAVSARDSAFATALKGAGRSQQSFYAQGGWVCGSAALRRKSALSVSRLWRPTAAEQIRSKKIQWAMTDGRSVTPEDLNPVLSVEIPKSPQSIYLVFKYLCERYDEPDLCVVWLLEAWHFHASYARAIAYVEGDRTASGSGSTLTHKDAHETASLPGADTAGAWPGP